MVIPELRIETSSIQWDVKKHMEWWRPKKTTRQDRNHDEKFRKTISDWNTIRVRDPFHLPELS